MITPSLQPRYERRGRVSVLSNSVGALPQIQDVPAGGHPHALEAKVGNWHVFRIYASHGPSLVDCPRHGGQYDDSDLDCVVYSRTVNGARQLICHSYRFELTDSINFEKPNLKQRLSSDSCQWVNSKLYLTLS